MPSVLDLRRRIRSVKNTRQITKAMKMVSAAKLRRTQERALSARPYARMLTSVLESLVRRVDVYDRETGRAKSPLLECRPERNATVLVVTGDKGFAGAFNANVIKAAKTFVEVKDNVRFDLEIVGRKGRDMLRHSYPPAAVSDENVGGEGARRRARKARIEISGEHSGLFDHLTFAKADHLAHILIDRYIAGETDAVYLVFNEFQSVIAQRVVAARILPIVEIGKQIIESAFEMDAEQREEMGRAALTSGVALRPEDTREADEEASKFGTAGVDYIYEQPPRELLRALLPRYITSQVYHALLESIAAEHAARMTAMDAATNNATEMIDAYTLTMNRLRQAAITKEIIEIVSGAAALS